MTPRSPLEDEMPEVIRIGLLGSFWVRVGSRTIEERKWRLRKAASLVKLLALAPNHHLHREQVMEWLWPGLDANAASNNLHRTLHFARRLLEPEALDAASRYLRLHGEQLQLCPEGPLWVDVEAFEEAAATARRSREPAAYRVALELYAGELLPEDRYEEWAEGRREELRHLYLALLLELAALYEEREEEPESAIEALKKALAIEPTHQEAHVGLMRLYARSGQRHRALRQYEELREALQKELGSEPDAASRRLYREIVEGRFPPALSPSALQEGRSLPEEPPPGDEPSSQHNLPAALSSFVGREREILELKRALAMSRLLTLTGTGGSGKTRLALEVAKDLVGAYPDGVWMVELAPLSEGELVVQAVAQALGVSQQPARPLAATLMDALKSRNMLLVLDNCEHLIDACAELVEDLLRACPHLRILATSREALGVLGEASWPVLPLSVPPYNTEGDLPPTTTVQSLTRYEAVRLFLERARSKLPAFELTPTNAGAVVEVCRRLEGIPLAIELATARLTALTVDQVAERLEDSLGLLTAGRHRTADVRHRTLRATLDWSYQLLSAAERRLFRRLSVFAGGWSLEAAEEVGAGGGIEQGEVLDLLGGLVEKSLVVAEASPGVGGGALRYRMLEPVRQYGREKLRESQEAREARRRHAHHYLALAETAEPELLGGGQAEWFSRLRLELGNLRGALWWSLEPGDEERARAELRLRLVAALWLFWDVAGFGEGKQWLQTALEKDPGGFPAVRAKALCWLGFILGLYQHDYKPAIAALEEAIALYKELGDLSGTGLAVCNLGYAVLHGGYRERLPTFVEEGEALMKGDLDGHTRAFLAMPLACAAMEEGDLELTVSQLEESLALCRELGDPRLTARTLFSLGMAELERDGLDRGAALLEEGARIPREMADRPGIRHFAWGLGNVAALRGRPVRAARLWGAVEALHEQMGMSFSHFELARYEQHLASARSSLDERTWAAEWSEGRAMSPEQAIEYALSEEEHDHAPSSVLTAPEHPPTGEPADRLTRREREVALLVAGELTNRQIALELSISEHTVANHIRNILKKLRLHSRNQIESQLIL